MTQATGTVRFFTDDDFEFAALRALGKAAQGTMDIGNVLATLARVADSDAASWLKEWRECGAQLERQGIAHRVAGKYETAGHFFLGAADAFARALAFSHALPDDSELAATFRRHRACWVDFIAASKGRHLALRVPYEGSFLPGFLLRPDASGARRATLVVTNGSDGSLSGLWAEGIKAGLERGHNVFVFDGPGQQSLRFERDVPLRHDWEAVLTPILDLLVTRTDVDASKLLAYGVSQGGFWLARALCFERRFLAAAVDGGVVDLSRAWYARLPRRLLAALRAGDAAHFNEAMAAGRGDAVEARAFAFRARPYGTFASPYDFFTALGKFVLDVELIEKIETPLLVLDPDDDDLFPGQSEELYDALACPKSIVRFKRDDGSGLHGQPLARSWTGHTVSDFFDEWLQ